MGWKAFINFIQADVRLALSTALTSLVFSATALANPTASPLQRVPSSELPPTLMADNHIFEHREEIVGAIHKTVAFLRTDAGAHAYATFNSASNTSGLDVATVERSITEFARLLMTSSSQEELEAKVRQRFDLYRSVGNDGMGTVKFTGYFRPVYKASRTRTKTYSYPIFRTPENFSTWTTHPTRVALEGWDGKGGVGTLLRGRELAWVKSRYDAFMIHVQGSALLDFTDGTRDAIGFAAGTNYPFRGIPADFLRKHKVSWGKLGEFFNTHPVLFNDVLSRNNRFIFFAAQSHSEPLGSLGVPVVDERSIAIDQGRLPPGAISIIRTALPSVDTRGALKRVNSSRFVLNLDSGSAIKGPGRVDVYMGTGEQARQLANSIFGNGQLYYLIAKNEVAPQSDVRAQMRP